jgi:hypothetical protein
MVYYVAVDLSHNDNADWNPGYLQSFSMVDRDAVWMDFLQEEAIEDDTVWRLINSSLL